MDIGTSSSTSSEIPLPCRATSPASSISSATSSSNSRKRSHDDISTSLDDINPAGNSNENENIPAQRPRLHSGEPSVTMSSLGLFGDAWLLYRRIVGSLFGLRIANTAVGGRNRDAQPSINTQVEKAEQRDYLEFSDTASASTRRTAPLHVDGADDLSSQAVTEQLKIGAPCHNKLTIKKSAATQQLPSPLASEDETPEKVVSHKRANSKNTQQAPRPSSGLENAFDVPTKPFNPKAALQKSSGETLFAARRLRDKHSEGVVSVVFPSPLQSYKHRSAAPRKRRVEQTKTPRTMGLSLSKPTQRWSPPSMKRQPTFMRRSRITKPTPKKLPEMKAFQRARAKGRAEDERLVAVIRQLKQETDRGFQSLKQHKERSRMIDVEVKRMRQEVQKKGEREVIPPLKGEQIHKYRKLVQEVQSDAGKSVSREYNKKRFDTETLRVTTHELMTVMGLDKAGGWLNDEVVNYYLGLICARENTGEKIRMIAHNSFFYKHLSTTGYKMIGRWTAKRGARGTKIFDLDYIFIPINSGFHWTLAVINFNLKRFEYYDSMAKKPSQACFKHLRTFVRAETGGIVDLSEWKDFWLPNAPKQTNATDCGVFLLKTAEILARGGQPNFFAGDIPNQRARMALELVDGKLMLP